MSALKPWSPLAPLEPGITLIEASAGTGKTYNITSLVVRLVAEQGVPIERILVVTYTRAATAELSDRIRARLSAAEEALAGSVRPDDAVVAAIHDRGPEVRAVARQRLRQAIGDVDLAMIRTIHGFCQRMLQVHAFESGVAFDLDLQPDAGPLVDELVDDHIGRTLYDVDDDRFVFLTEAGGVTRDALGTMVGGAIGAPDARVVPEPAAIDEAAWGDAVAALARRWPELGAQLVEQVAADLAAAKAGDPSVFKPRQRTYTVAKAKQWVAGVQGWLDEGAALGSALPDADRFTPARMANQLVDPGVPLEAPALEALDALFTLAAAMASGVRAQAVVELRAQFEALKAERRVQTYDDLLRGLASRLGPESDPETREALCASMGGAFDAALIDEFQDTDPYQWAIFRAAFGQGAHHLYLIGDPKQAIYAFRGANVHVYGEAALAAGERRFTMDTNWRSDGRLLEGLDALLNHEGAFGPTVPFDFVPVRPPPGRDGDTLRPADGFATDASAPVQLRWVDHRLVGGEPPEKPLAKGAVEGPLLGRIAADVVGVLQEGSHRRVDGMERPLAPGDIAVLVRTGRQAVLLQEALQRVGVPAVLTGAQSVLASDEARTLQQWLEALARHHGGASERVAASSPWFGWSAEQLAAVEREEPAALRAWDGWRLRLAEWRVTLRRRGVMAALHQALDDENVVVRLLGFDDGERRVTNLFHVAELVHRVEREGRLKLEGLVAWLAARRRDDDLDRDEKELRLDRDSNAVRLMTMHASKGLEFPVCFVPWLWTVRLPVPGEPVLVVPDPADRARRIVDVRTPTDPDTFASACHEAREEALRLGYVALTRAKHRCVVYTGWIKGYDASPLAAWLHGESPDRLATGAARVAEGWEPCWADLQALADASEGADGRPRVVATACEPAPEVRYMPPPASPPDLVPRVFTRARLDPGWRRHSYTSLTRAAGHPELVEEGREGFDADAVDDGPVAPVDDADVVPLAALPGGADAGTMLHEVLERVDFAGHDGVEVLPGQVHDRLEAHGFDPERYGERLVEGLQQVFATPLGGGLAGLTLADLPRASRLDEMRFDLPLLGGAHPPPGTDPVAPTRALAAILRRRDDGVLPAGWLATLSRLDGLELAGFLTGSIDLVVRAPGAEGRWFVIDYKSNRLTDPATGRCVPSAFGQAAMTAEMARHDYFLQYHLYLVALHRYLRWRLDDYDYDRHMGGAAYLFLRGMVGPQTSFEGGQAHGCWFDRPPREVIEALDAALAGPSPQEAPCATP